MNKITREDVRVFKEMSICQMQDYQRIATKSAIYPGQGTPLGLAYVALKLNGEAGEFAEHVGKAMRDDEYMPYAQLNDVDLDKQFVCLTGNLTPERRTALLKEIGDVLWYLSAACNELGVSLSDVALMNLEKLCDRGERDKLRGSGDER